MTTSEEQQAQHLANWIDGDRSTLPHEDVAVAIWALRPDLAPKPRVSIEDVLSLVRSGPFSSDDNVLYEDDSNDDFVLSVFAQVEAESPNRVSLDDVLSRIQTGPFSSAETPSLEKDSDAVQFHVVSEGGLAETLDDSKHVPKNTLNDVSSTSVSANNNHWWRTPWLAGGLATALVFFVLLPSGFESPVSEDSIFAPKPQFEESRFVEFVEEVEEVSQKQASRLSPTIDAGSVQLSNEDIQPAAEKIEASSILELLADKDATEGNIEAYEDSEQVTKDALPQKKSILKSASVGGAGGDSVQVETKPISMTSPVSRNSVVEAGAKQDEQDNKEKDSPASMEASVDEDLSPSVPSVPSRKLEVPIEEVMKEESAEDAEEMEESLDYLDESDLVKQEREVSVVTASTATDIQATSQESIVSNRVRSKRKGGLLKAKQSARQPLSSASEDVVTDSVVMTESKTFATQSESSVQLPLVLSSEQQNTIQTLRTPEEIFALCNASSPTKSLEVLWLSSMNLPVPLSIEVLKVSAEYDHGDVRYLKRNWLRLAILLRRSGDVTLAAFYESQAAALP